MGHRFEGTGNGAGAVIACDSNTGSLPVCSRLSVLSLVDSILLVAVPKCIGVVSVQECCTLPIVSIVLSGAVDWTLSTAKRADES